MWFRSRLVIDSDEDIHLYYGTARRIAKAILEFEVPVTVALSGQYGSGKSSVVAMTLKELGFSEATVRAAIEKRDPRALQSPIVLSGKNQDLLALGAVYLDASVWEDSSDLFGTLLFLLAKQFRVERDVKNSLKKVFLVPLSFLNARATGMQPGGIKELKKIARKEIENITEDTAARLQLKDEVGKILKKVLEKTREGKSASKSRLLVILDNLDRVAPEQTMKLLRSIHMYLPEHEKVFILVCFDRKVIDRFLMEELGITESITYLSKYIDLFWGMPLPKRTAIGQIISKFLKQAPENCFAGHENFQQVLARMLERGGVANVKVLEMILRSFIWALHSSWDTVPRIPYGKELPDASLKNLFGKMNKATDLLKTDFGLMAAGRFYITVVYTRWPWLYDAFYLFGESGRSFDSADIISALIPFCDKQKLESDPYVHSFLASYRYLTLWWNPGVDLTESFTPYRIPKGVIRKHIVGELESTE